MEETVEAEWLLTAPEISSVSWLQFIERIRDNVLSGSLCIRSPSGEKHIFPVLCWGSQTSSASGFFSILELKLKLSVSDSLGLTISNHGFSLDEILKIFHLLSCLPALTSHWAMKNVPIKVSVIAPGLLQSLNQEFWAAGKTYTSFKLLMMITTACWEHSCSPVISWVWKVLCQSTQQPPTH